MCERCARVAPPETKSGQTLGRRGTGSLLEVASSRCVWVAPPGSPIGCATGHAATERCHDPEPDLTDLLSHEDVTSSFTLSDHMW